MTYRGSTLPILGCADAPVFLAIADTFTTHATQHWFSRFGERNWQQLAKAAQALLERFEIGGFDDLTLFKPPSASDHLNFASCHFKASSDWALLPLEQSYRKRVATGPHNEPFALYADAVLAATSQACAKVPLLEPSDTAASGAALTATPTPDACSLGKTNNDSNTINDGKTIKDDKAINDGKARKMDAADKIGVYRQTALASVGMHFAQSMGERSDHLSVMLTFLAFLLHNKMLDESHKYLHAHFEWLPTYRRELLQIAPHASFYALLLDILSRVKAAPLQQYYCWQNSPR